MEPKDLAVGSSERTGDQSEALNQNPHTASTQNRDVPDDSGTDSAVGDRDWALALRASREKSARRRRQLHPTRDGCGSPKAKNWRRGRVEP